MLDIIQTIPRSELFALSASDLLDMAMAVVDLGSRRRTLLFLRADQLAHFVSCLVYLPRDRYTTAVRLEMQDILVRELGGVEHRLRRAGQRIALGGGAFHRSAAGRLASAATSTSSLSQRVADPEPAHRGRPHLGRPADRRGARPVRSTRPTPSTTPTAFPEVYKQAVAPLDAIDDIAIIEELQDNSVKLVFADGE